MNNEIEFKVDVFLVDNEKDKERLCRLKTRAMNGDNIQIIKEETNFTKDGRYLIALQWAVTTKKSEATDEVYRAITEEV